MHPTPDYRFEQLVQQRRQENAAQVRQARYLQQLQRQRKPKIQAWGRFIQLLTETTRRPLPTTSTARAEV